MEPVEVALMLEDGQVWGANVTLPKHWSDVRVPFSDFHYFSHWNVPEFRKGFTLDIRRLDIGTAQERFVYIKRYVIRPCKRR